MLFASHSFPALDGIRITPDVRWRSKPGTSLIGCICRTARNGPRAVAGPGPLGRLNRPGSLVRPVFIRLDLN